jgi:hypothetical protein
MTVHMRSLLLALVLPAAAVAQQTRTLGKPDAEFTDPFSAIASIRELPDGRVIVVDTRENRLRAINFATGASASIGSEGSGPGEWRTPIAVYRLPGDSTLLQDPANGRFLIIGPDAKPSRVFLPTGGVGGTLRATDSRGMMYYQAPALRVTPEGPIALDSIPVIRYDPVRVTHDTIAFVAVPKVNLGAPATAGGVRSISGVSSPYAPADDWAVLPDGRVIVVRTSDYHVEIVESRNRRVAGPAVPFTRIPVTEVDKERWRAQAKLLRPTFRSSTGQPVTPPANFQLPEPEWQETKPAFSRGNTVVAPNGEIWVMRNRHSSDDTPTADAFNVQGRLVGRVVFPKGSQFVGFGAKWVYLARTDEDGLQYLQRYALN